MNIYPLLAAGGRRILVTVAFLVLALALICVLWTVSVHALALDAFGTPTPLDVWSYWVGQPDSAAHRDLVLGAMWTTLGHALTGYLVGTVLGVLLAMLFVTVPAVERATLPTVLLIQTVPILAILPLFILLFGRGLLVTTIITGLTVFFPTLVWVSQGLRSPKSTTLDFFQSVAATPWTVMTRLRFPSAVAGVFVAARLAVPGAVFGAFVSEWLATGDGLGYLVVISMQGVGGYEPLWATVSVTTLMTMALYVIVEIAESMALAYYAPERLIRR